MKNNHLLWAWVIKNSVAIICWTALAIFFGKWWIALFSGLFLSDLKVHGRTIICDTCGKRTPPQVSLEEARAEAQRRGWLTYKEDGQDKDMCPECQIKRRADHERV